MNIAPESIDRFPEAVFIFQNITFKVAYQLK